MSKQVEYLSNGILEVAISTRGAELQSIRRVSSPFEYLWHGDAAFWDRRSPILFPIVGTLWENTAHIDGATYPFGQHGFARDMEFRKIVDEDRHMAFTLSSDASTFALFPFAFELRIDYTLLRNVLTVTWTVSSSDDVAVPFHIGAHPGFMLPHFCDDDDLHGYLSLDVSAPLRCSTLDGAYVDGGVAELPIPANGLLPLCADTFICPTLVDATSRVHRITLHDKEARPIVTLRHTMPVTAIWTPAPDDAPFLCIEPWCGCCDHVGYTGEFAERPFTQFATSGQPWTTSYDIIIE